MMERKKPKKRHLIKVIVIKPRTPKWKRKFLIKKEAGEYLTIDKSERCLIVKKYYKSKHFLKWVIKLLVPDFLIGHPNLWDNLKTLRKHPRFKPLRMALVAWLIFSMTFGSLYLYLQSPTFAADYTDDTEAEFSAGTYSDTQWDGTNSWVELTDTGKINGSGDYTSSVKDAGGETSWDNIAWTPEQPYYKELPNNKGQESGYPAGNADMTGNVLLMHMNEESGTIVDSSGEGNDGTTYGGVTYGENGKLNTALSFDGVDDYVSTGLNPDAEIGDSNAFTVSVWIKPNDDTTNQEAIGSWYANDKRFYFGIINGSYYWGLGSVYDRNTQTVPEVGKWQHLVWVYEGGAGNMLIYFNGINTYSQSYTGNGDMPEANIPIGGTKPFNGTIDEVAIYNRALSAEEILDNYKRGALRLKYQVRSGATNPPTGDFVGPDGTTETYYSELDNNSTTTPSFNLTNVFDNPYFQYKAYFETDDSSYTPELKSVTTDYTLLNSPPDQPTNVSPSSGAIDQDLNVTLIGSAYNDADGDPQTDADWQVDDDSDFSSPEWTRMAGVAETTTTVNSTNGTFANGLAGKTELSHNTTYYWRVRYKDSVSGWSDWSTATNFITNLVHTPSNLTPTDGVTGQDLNVSLTASAFGDDQTGHTHQDASWQVDNDSDFSSPVWTRTAGVAETSTVVNTTNGSFANELAGKTELDHNTTYYWRVRYQCSSGFWSDWSTFTSFTTNLIHAPENQSPTDGATVTTLSPLLEASVFSDDQSSHTHAASQWQVDDNSDFSSPEYDSGETTSGETSHSIPAGYLANFSNYYWRVRYKDSSGFWSDWSTATSFSIQISATAVDVRPILSGDSFRPGESIPIEVQLLNFSDGSPLNGASTTLDIYNPSGTKVVDGAAMTYQTGSNGIYKYSYTAPSTNGSYRYEVTATQDGDSGYGSANFYITRPYILRVEPLGHNTNIKGGDSINLDVQVINAVDDSVINDASATITIRNPSGTALVTGTPMTYVSGSDGIYRYSYITPATTGTYSFEVSAVKGGVTGYASSNFYISPTAATVASEATAQAESRTEVTEIKEQVKAGILDAPKTAKSGDTITIKYKAKSGLSGAGAPKLNVYDASDVQRVADETMTEIALTGVYQADLTLDSDWGTGFFTVLVSENTNNTSDHIQIFVGAYDVQDIGAKATDIQTKTTDIQTKVTNVQSNMDILIGAMIVTQSTVNDVSASTTSFTTTLTNSVDNFYKNAVLTFTSGDLDGQTRRISDYDGSLKKITLDPALTSAPANGDSFTIVKQNVHVEEQLAGHEAAQAESRTKVEDIQTKTTDIQAKATDIQLTVDATYALLQTVDDKIDTVDTNLNTLLLNLQTLDDNVDTILAKWGTATAEDIVNDIAGVKTVVDSIRLSQQLNYLVELSDTSKVLTGDTYRAELTILNYESQPTDAVSNPSITLYDALRNVVATSTMTKLSTGVYEYTYNVPSEATSGSWETVVSVDLGGALPIIRQNYWEVGGSPAQVIINSISDLSVSSIVADVTISNEGAASYEYPYEWCVVSTEDNACGGGDDVFYSSATKYIVTGEDWNTSLSATVPNTGNYWFKVVVYYGTEASGASQMFTAVEEEEQTTPPLGGGGEGETTVSLTKVYNKLLEVQKELGFHGKTRTAYEDMRVVKGWVGALPEQMSQPIYKEISDISKSLVDMKRTTNVDFSSPALQSLLDVSKVNTANLQDIKNKLADLRAVSSATRRLVEQTTTKPLVETWMTFNSVQFNFLITNPLAETKTLKFKSYLPVEVKPEYIMDLDGLSIDYDSSAASYYVHGDITLGPNEAVTKKVEIKDIWVFSEDEIESLKKQGEVLAKPLEKTQYEAQGALLKNGNEAILNTILLKQKEGYRTPQDHIVAYRVNAEKIAEVKRNLEKMKNLVVQAGASQGVVGKVGGIQTFATWGIILAIVSGFGLLAAVIFAMWRHQTMLAMAAMNVDKKEVLAPLHKKKRPKKKRGETGTLKSVALDAGGRARSGVSFIKMPFVWRLPWKKILIWVVIIGVVGVLAILAIKFTPGLFGSRTITFKEETTPAVAPVSNESAESIVPKMQDNVEIVFKKTSNPRLKILDTPTGWLNVRDDSSLEGNIITKVYPNEQYEYTDKKNDWYFIIIPKGKSGWVFKKYVQEIKG